jgi:hypothetical protein
MLAQGPPSRVVIAGGPRAGKSSLARTVAVVTGRPLFASDDLAGMGWSEASEYAAKHWLDADGPWLAEGVALPRALRKWLAANPEGKPADVVLFFNGDVTHRSPGQTAMAKGCVTVMREIAPELMRRGVQLVSI